MNMKKRKILAAVIFLVLTVVFITGCDGLTTPALTLDEPATNSTTNNTHQFTTDNKPFEMEYIGRSTKHGFDYYRDTVTDVVYLLHQFNSKSSYAGAGGSGLTVMLDPETGLPMTYTRYMALYNAQNNS